MNGLLGSKLPGGRCEGRSREWKVKTKVEGQKALRCNPLYLGSMSISLNLLAVPILRRRNLKGTLLHAVLINGLGLP